MMLAKWLIILLGSHALIYAFAKIRKSITCWPSCLMCGSTRCCILLMRKCDSMIIGGKYFSLEEWSHNWMEEAKTIYIIESQMWLSQDRRFCQQWFRIGTCLVVGCTRTVIGIHRASNGSLIQLVKWVIVVPGVCPLTLPGVTLAVVAARLLPSCGFWKSGTGHMLAIW